MGVEPMALDTDGAAARAPSTQRRVPATRTHQFSACARKAVFSIL